MKISQTNNGTQTVSGSHTLATVTTPGLYWLHVDLNAVADGDVFEVWAQEKVLTGSTSRQCTPKYVFQHGQSIDNQFIGPFDCVHELSFHINKVSGTNRDVDWSVRRGVVNLEEWLGTAPLALTSQRVEVLVGSMAADVVTASAIAADAIGSSELAAAAATEIADAVWAVAARTLTALDEDSTTIDLDAAIRAALGLASANLDTQLAAIDDAVDTEVAAIKAVTDLLTLSAVADAVLDEVVEGSTTMRQMLRGMASALLAKVSGAATTTIAIRDLADSKDRITATVDADGNRSAVTLDLT